MGTIAASTFLVIRPLIERHVGDAAFYWAQHDQSIHSPLINLGELYRFDRLLDAHLDGIRVAGDAGWQLAREALLRWKGAGEVFVCAYLALHENADAKLAEIMDVVSQQPRRLLRGLISALLWLPTRQSLPHVHLWLQLGQSPLHQISAWRALACSPDIAQTTDNLLQRLQQASQSGNEHVRAAACRAGLHVPAAKDWLIKSLSDPVIAVAVEAAITLQRKGQSEGHSILLDAVQVLAEQSSALAGHDRKQALHRLARWVRHLALAMKAGDPAAEKLLKLLPPRLGLSFVLHHGDAAWLEWVQEQMHIPECARLAGWVWSCLTGIDLESQGLALCPEQEQARDYPTNILDPGLPIPNAHAIARARKLPPVRVNTAVLLGQPVTELDIAQVWSNSPQAIRWIVTRRCLETRHLNTRQHARLQRLWHMPSINTREKATDDQIA